MPASTLRIHPPSITALKQPFIGRSPRISTDTYVRLQTETPDCKIYFTTDGSEPDPHKRGDAVEKTFKYRAPFRLKPGARAVHALAISRKGHLQSLLASKAFIVEDLDSRDFMEDDDTVISNISDIIDSDIQSIDGLNSCRSNSSKSGLMTHTDDLSDINYTTPYIESDFALNTTDPLNSARSSRSRLDDEESISTDILLDPGYGTPRHQTPRRTPSPRRYSARDRSPHRDVALGVSGGGSGGGSASTSIAYPRQIHPNSTDLTGRYSPRHYTRDFPQNSHVPAPTYEAHNSTDFSHCDYINEPYVPGSIRDQGRRSPITSHVSRRYQPPAGSRDTDLLGNIITSTGVETETDAEVSQYFQGRHNQVDSLHRPKPRSPYYGDTLNDVRQSPPAFWSTTTPRVRFTEPSRQRLSPTPVQAYSHNRRSLSPHLSNDRDSGRTTPVQELGYNLGYDMAQSQKIEDRVSHQRPIHRVVESSTEDDVKTPAHSRRSRKDHFDKEEQEREKMRQARLKKYEKKDKDKANKKMSEIKVEKKKTSTSSPAPSSSSLSSSSSSSSDSDSSKKKKKKEEKKKKKVTDVVPEKKGNKFKQGEPRVPDVSPPPSVDHVASEKLISGDHATGSSPIVPAKRQAIREAGRTLQSTDGHLNFINDSGTQINFWGVQPDEVMNKVDTLFKSSMKKPAQQVPIHANQSIRECHSAPSNRPVIKAAHQKDQQGISSFFKNIFGGGDKEKDKKEDKKKKGKKDNRSTVYGEGDELLNKMTFEKIQSECMKDGSLWEDPDFIAEDASLFYKDRPVEGDIEWKRPSELCADPQMIVGGASRFDIKQGVLGNCWLLAAVASLTTNEKLLRKVVPMEQSFHDSYAGVFHFRLWQYGRWVEVCVDDRLPTSNGNLIFMHSNQGNEFWSPLLEKAYAKLCGSYEALTGGLTSEGMTDFTGGVTECFNFREELLDNMYSIMLKAQQRGDLLGCSIDASPDQIEQELDNGLIMGHAYSITDVKQVETDDGLAQLVRVRNPWGNEHEWTGAWSDQSSEWNELSEEARNELGLDVAHDGEFWMSFKDFSTHFQRVEICHLSPEAMDEESDDNKTKWVCNVLHGEWKKNSSAGGCRNFKKTFWINPQYRVEVTDPDDDDEEDLGTVIVGLMQVSRRKMRKEGQDNFTIGYEIYKLNKEKGKLDKDYFRKTRPEAMCPQYINMREVCGRHRLSPGEYCIVPTTYEANEEAKFVLRTFSEKQSSCVELDENTCLVEAKNMQNTQSSAPLSRGLTQQATEMFQQHGGEDGEVDAFELKNILDSVYKKDFKFAEFDINICRSMLAFKDTDKTGKLGEEEFKELWDELQSWKNIFKKFDEDNSGYFSSLELKEALKHTGYSVSNSTFATIVTRFCDKHGFIQFVDFIGCLLKLRSMFAIYQEELMDLCDVISIDEFIQRTLYS